jgi:hypothetical protein
MNRTNKRHATGVLPATLALVLGMMLIAAEPSVSAEDTSETTAAMRQARKKAAQRRRRIMYNDDGCHTRPYSTPEEFLSLRLNQLIGTQVDTICYWAPVALASR